MFSLFKSVKATSLLLTGAILSSLLVSCAAPTTPNETDAAEETAAETLLNGETTAETEDPAYQFSFPGRTELKPSGIPDDDADTLSTITIRTAEELLKIGNDPAYPLNGDYTLVADLDLSHLGNFTPIGGAFSESGIVSGNNVFTGTFDGRGHTLQGLYMSVSETERIHVGLFGSVGSAKESDPAVIKNLILKNVTVIGPAMGPATYAALIGQASGYVTLDNIALLSGKVEINNDTGDILGIGSLIGQCRTLDTTGCTNGGIHISNVFTNITVIGDNNGRSNYTSGLIGRIRGSDLGSLTDVVQIGSVTHEGGQGHAISTGDSKITTRKNVYYQTEVGTDEQGYGVELSLVALTKGSTKFASDLWYQENGLPPFPKCVYESPLFSPLDFLTLTFSGKNTANAVKYSFTLPKSVLGVPVKWLTDNEKRISIEGEQAIVKPPKTGSTEVTLTAYSATAAKDFVLQVVSDAEAELMIDHAGKVLYAKNYPAGTVFTWNITKVTDGTAIASFTESEGKLPLTDDYLNCKISVEAEGFDTLSHYYSNLPTLVITSAASYSGVKLDTYSNGTMKICTTEKYQKTEYDDVIEIRGRGNTTAYQAKRPFRLKLSTKTELFGMEKSKHWVLLANNMDRSNLRNKLSYDLGMSLGLATCESVFVNLIFNGEYKGLYQLCEPIRIEDGRVDIFNWEDTAEEVANRIAAKEGLSDKDRELLAEGMKTNLKWVTSGKYKDYTISDYYDTSTLNTTGGFLIEHDVHYDELTKFTTPNHASIMINSPEYLYTNSEMFSYIKNYIIQMEEAMYSPNRQSSEGLHYSDYMDIVSYMDFLFVNLVFKNVELFFKSCFMYKDVDGLLTFGPIWDMDWAAGNHVNLDMTSRAVDRWKHGQSREHEYWHRALYNDPYFMVLLCDRWAEIQGNLDDMMAELDAVSEEIRVEAELNYEFWQYTKKQKNQVEVDDLRKWLTDRIDWMSEQMVDPHTLLKSFGYYQSSRAFTIADTKDTGDYLELTVTVQNAQRVKACDVVLNGRIILSEELTGKNVIRIDKSLLRESGKANAIEILGKNAAGNYSIALQNSGSGGASQAESQCLFYVTP